MEQEGDGLWRVRLDGQAFPLFFTLIARKPPGLGGVDRRERLRFFFLLRGCGAAPTASAVIAGAWRSNSRSNFESSPASTTSSISAASARGPGGHAADSRQKVICWPRLQKLVVIE